MAFELGLQRPRVDVHVVHGVAEHAVAELAQAQRVAAHFDRRDARVQRVEVRDQHAHVDDRLGRQPGYRGGADVRDRERERPEQRR